MATARSETTVDDGTVRVTTWTFGDGDETGYHRHEFDYLVVPVTGGTYARVFASGETADVQQVAGVPFTGAAGAEHNLVNKSGRPAVFVEVEFTAARP